MYLLPVEAAKSPADHPPASPETYPCFHGRSVVISLLHISPQNQSDFHLLLFGFVRFESGLSGVGRYRHDGHASLYLLSHH